MKQTNKQQGFALVEGVLVLVIVAAIAGVGFYVVKQKNVANDSYNNALSDSVRSKNTKNALDPNKVGTLSGVEAVSNASAQDDSKVEQEIESDSLNNSQSDKTDVQEVGDSVNENSL